MDIAFFVEAEELGFATTTVGALITVMRCGLPFAAAVFTPADGFDASGFFPFLTTLNFGFEFVAVFFAGAFLATGFLAGAFLEAAFFAGAFLGAAFFFTALAAGFFLLGTATSFCRPF